MAEIEIGKVTHYFSKAGVVAIQIAQDTLRVGDTIHVKGHTSDFTQKIDSMQIDNQPVAEADGGAIDRHPGERPRPGARPGVQGGAVGQLQVAKHRLLQAQAEKRPPPAWGG